MISVNDVIQLKEFEPPSPWMRPAFFALLPVALVHCGLGESDRALAWLEKAYVERSDYMPYLGLDPMLDGLRSDYRFAALVGRVGLSSR